MRTAMRALCPVFNTNRMVHQYVVEAYCPAEGRRARWRRTASAARARWHTGRRRCAGAWKGVRVARVEVGLPPESHVGTEVEVRAWMQAPGLAPEDLAAQVLLGKLSETRDIVEPEIVPMTYQETAPGDGMLFRANVPCKRSGAHGLTVRVLPRHEDLGHPHETGLIAWAG